MILGIGTDLVQIDGFRRQLADRASRFLDGVFTPGERRDAELRPTDDVARHLAARYAAKEAFVKAWSGSRHGRPPRLSTIDLGQIEVRCDAWGRPTIALAAPLADHVGPVVIHTSLSHDGAYATATVVLEAPPEAP